MIMILCLCSFSVDTQRKEYVEYGPIVFRVLQCNKLLRMFSAIIYFVRPARRNFSPNMIECHNVIIGNRQKNEIEYQDPALVPGKWRTVQCVTSFFNFR